MEPDIANLPPPGEEEFRWLEAQPDDDHLFPGQSGIVAYRMRMRFEATERTRHFAEARGKLRKTQRPHADREAA